MKLLIAKVTFHRRLERKKTKKELSELTAKILGKGISDKGSSMSKSPEPSVYLTNFRISNEGRVVNSKIRVVEEAHFRRDLRVIETQDFYSK